MIRHGILGLAIGERSASCAQVLLRGKRRSVERLARFEFPAGASLDQPEALGQALRSFLDAHDMRARAVAIGVPARWLIAQERELPPTDESAAISMLLLQAERLAVEEMVFDVDGPLESPQPGRVMLVGILRKQLDRIRAVCTAAGLKPAAIGPTAMAVSRLVGGDERPLVVMSEQGSELVWRQGSSAVMLRHLAAADAGGGTMTGAIAGELRRTLLLRPAQASAPAGVLLCGADRTGHGGEAAELSERSGLRVERFDSLGATEVDAQALNGSSGRETPEMYLPAIAVALSAAQRDGMAVDFEHPRLVPPHQSRITRTSVLAIAAGVAVVLGLAALYLDVKSREAEAAELDQRLSGMKESLKDAEARLERFSYGRTYYEHRPPVLDCLRDISEAFGTDSAIWATGFSLRDRRGTLQGKATSQPAVLALLDRLRASGRFADAQLTDMRESSGSSRDITFSMSFTYTGAQHAQ